MDVVTDKSLTRFAHTDPERVFDGVIYVILPVLELRDSNTVSAFFCYFVFRIMLDVYPLNILKGYDVNCFMPRASKPRAVVQIGGGM